MRYQERHGKTSYTLARCVVHKHRYMYVLGVSAKSVKWSGSYQKALNAIGVLWLAGCWNLNLYSNNKCTVQQQSKRHCSVISFTCVDLANLCSSREIPGSVIFVHKLSLNISTGHFMYICNMNIERLQNLPKR